MARRVIVSQAASENRASLPDVRLAFQDFLVSRQHWSDRF
ncbi:MAG TPA: hypothetical protein DEB17_00030 [Chlorobaculum sp.]|uniref:Uncharacterized protein n=1 Tax=Chlorobaculum tepidum (strain ATCC 49652 / DSM 12025 / NBRC 103806 / TLS) TaxID=194439 RepID=Q8KC94_CHLTE|nr:hypothetical protein CT1531 [Chlorobaculum tepidum TLS]HBU22386.1 hypothetical protein [Chlorobaculum sp.]